MVKEELMAMSQEELVEIAMKLDREREKLEEETSQYKNWWHNAEIRLKSMQRKLRLLQELIESWN